MLPAVAESLALHRMLSLLVDGQRQKLLAQPYGDLSKSLGLISKGDTRDDILTRINSLSDKLDDRLRRSAVMDCCAAFEREFLAKVGTALGHARTVLTDGYTLNVFGGLSERLLKNKESFGSLEAQFGLLEGMINEELTKKLRCIREQRNDAAHGAVQLRHADLSLDDLTSALANVCEELGFR